MERSGEGFTVSVTLSGSYEGGVLIGAAYGADGHLLALRKQACTQEEEYTFSFSDEAATAAEFQVFLWDGGSSAAPLAAGVALDVPSV